ncbi:hypothetical protein [uncultured Chryseobacterium sp.]|uniref:hypothetical protein n=1 Tax=uncultured Chryseobacterium sp. TaxID=259322 RepID=UPI0025F82530|nr:hypothetical protein [uncultured Chryseobacterium sp.]
MGKVALIIIYNHKFDKNIDIVENLYKNRFSEIYHLVPFYDGDKSNVIPVYENSHYFQGYVAQGFKSYFKEKYEHYFFIGDDLILNPQINENNYTEHLKLNNSTCFLPGFIYLHDKKSLWGRVQDAFKYNINLSGVEIKNELPTYDDAVSSFKKLGLEVKPVSFDLIHKKPNSIFSFAKKVIRDKTYIFKYLINKNYNLPYPMVGSYSDIFVVSADSIRLFTHYCGVFAATNLFVEIGLPTAMVLSAKKIITEKELQFQGKALWPDGYARMDGSSEYAKDDYKELEKFNYSLKELIEKFPENYLYLHPIKLSKWNTQL